MAGAEGVPVGHFVEVALRVNVGARVPDEVGPMVGVMLIVGVRVMVGVKVRVGVKVAVIIL